MAKRAKFLVLNVEGLKFLEEWFAAQRSIPPNLTRMYQLMLHMVILKGTISVAVARKIGYTGRVVGEAVKRGYVEVS